MISEWEKEKRFMEKKYHDFTMDDITIKDIDNENEVGYTVNEPYIYLSYRNCITKSLKNESERKLFRLGVFIHETGHKIFSDFSTRTEYINKFNWFEKQIFAEISNVMEDPAIEWLICHVIPVFYKKCLRFHNQAIYNWSKPVSDEKSAYGQLISAMIQVGDGFPFKGEFTFEESEKIFEKILPILKKCTEEKDAKKRFQYMKEVFNLTKPLWKRKEKEEKEKLLKEIQELLKQKAVHLESNESSGIIIPYIDGSEQNPIEKAMNTGGKHPKQQTDNDSLSEELKWEMGKCLEEEKKQEQEVENYDIESQFFENVTVKNNKAEYKKEYIEIYKKITKRYEQEIDDFYATLKKYFKKQPAKQKRSVEGKLNEERFLRKNTARIFEKHKRDTQKQDVAIIVLMDLSGSMSGRKIKETMKMAIIISEAATRIGAKIYVLGFHSTTVDCQLEHFVSWENTEEDRISLATMQANGGNFDGYAVRYAGKLLRDKKAFQKMLFVIHDGCPTGPYKQRADGIADVRDAVAEISEFADVLGVAMECNDNAFKAMYQDDFVSIVRAEQLSDILCEKIIEKMEEK